MRNDPYKAVRTKERESTIRIVFDIPVSEAEAFDAWAVAQGIRSRRDAFRRIVAEKSGGVAPAA